MEFSHGERDREITQILLFLICGGLAALVNISVGYFLYEVIGLRDWLTYQMSVAVAYMSGMAVNFFLNRYLTFRNFSRGALAQGRTFLFVAGFGLVLTACLSFTLRLLLGTFVFQPIDLGLVRISHEAAAHVLSVALVSVYSFLGHKFLTFDLGIRALVKRLLGRRIGE